MAKNNEIMRNKKRSMLGESINYLKESKNYLYLAALLFLIGLFIGYAFSAEFSFLDVYLSQLVNEIKGLNVYGMTAFIFQNNIMSAFLTIFFGMFLGILPIINAFSNGVLLGYVIFKVAAIDGLSSMWKIFPHGIFELPAILIAIGLGMKLGFGVFTNYFRRYKNAKDRVTGILSAVFGAIGLLFVISSFSPLMGIESGNALGWAYYIIAFLLGAGLIVQFLLFFFLDRKLRKIQKATFLERFYLSVKVFLTIILPLLIVSAIIEGILIEFLK